MSNTHPSPEQLPLVWPDTADVRRTDPPASHTAADRAVRKVPVKLGVERVLADAGRPLTADQIWGHLRNYYGVYCSRERVRTVLNEGAGLASRARDRFHAFTRLAETAPSDLGNPSHLWTLAGGAA